MAKLAAHQRSPVSGSFKFGYINPVTAAVTYPVEVTSGGDILPLGNFYISAASRGLYSAANGGNITIPTNGSARIASVANANTFDLVTADWGTKISAEAVSYLANDVQNIGTARGLLSITIGTANATCVYVLSGTTTTELSDPGTLCTVTKDGSATVNIYWDTNAFFIQNKIAGTRTIIATLIGG